MRQAFRSSHENLQLAVGQRNHLPDDTVAVFGLAQTHQFLAANDISAYADGGAVDPNAYSNVPGVGYVPVDLTPFRDALGNAVTQFATLPQRAFEASETMRKGGDYDPAPALETAGLMAGARFPFARAGEAATFGGKLYSAAHEAVQNAPMTQAPGSQWLGYLRNQPGVKNEELQWLGITPEFLQSQRGPVTREQLLAHVKEHQQLELRDVVKSTDVERNLSATRNPAGYWEIRDNNGQFITNVIDGGNMTEAEAITEAGARLRRNKPSELGSLPKFESYTLPGGRDYREMLLTMPDRVPPEHRAAVAMMDERARRELAAKYPEQMGYQSPHFEERNILAHVRFNDREINGKKTLFIEEVQSDWHQAGKREGYKKQTELPPPPRNFKEFLADKGITDDAEVMRLWRDRVSPESVRLHDEHTAEVTARLYARAEATAGVPAAPFRTSWPELAMKRILRYAADHDYDQIAWTPGHVQATRNDLSKHVDYIDYVKERNGNYRLGVVGKNGEAIDLPKETFTPNELANYVGKDVADKIVSGEGQTGGGRTTLRGLDLRSRRRGHEQILR